MRNEKKEMLIYKNKYETEGVYEKLKEDHRIIEKIFKGLLNSGKNQTDFREQKFSELKNFLEAHIGAEEKFFYPLTKSVDSTEQLTLEAYEEHQIAKTLLIELEELDVSDAVWLAKIKVLSEAVKHHIKEEENELFPLAKKVIGKDKALKLGQEVDEFERKEINSQVYCG